MNSKLVYLEWRLVSGNIEQPFEQRKYFQGHRFYPQSVLKYNKRKHLVAFFRVRLKASHQWPVTVSLISELTSNNFLNCCKKYYCFLVVQKATLPRMSSKSSSRVEIIALNRTPSTRSLADVNINKQRAERFVPIDRISEEVDLVQLGLGGEGYSTDMFSAFSTPFESRDIVSSDGGDEVMEEVTSVDMEPVVVDVSAGDISGSQVEGYYPILHRLSQLHLLTFVSVLAAYSLLLKLFTCRWSWLNLPGVRNYEKHKNKLSKLLDIGRLFITILCFLLRYKNVYKKCLSKNVMG